MRQAILTVYTPVCCRTEPLYLLVDSTGLKICGKREWKVKKHGAGYCRTGRKIHLAIDAATLDVRAEKMTDYRQDDAEQAEARLLQLNLAEPLASVSGDGAYDTVPLRYLGQSGPVLQEASSKDEEFSCRDRSVFCKYPVLHAGRGSRYCPTKWKPPGWS
ncbi:transposase [Laribacter hongkongensis]|uniref:transposase n=1 Tax=Laribacter hongkongensis TaxID=168471 RepID=UPI0022B29C6A|nr:transposase [Laribacter hongkongensis]